MIPYRAHFSCIARCEGEYPLDEVIYRCSRCGNLFEVIHDMVALKQRSAGEWKKTFESRFMITRWPFGSGI